MFFSNYLKCFSILFCYYICCYWCGLLPPPPKKKIVMMITVIFIFCRCSPVLECCLKVCYFLLAPLRLQATQMLCTLLQISQFILCLYVRSWEASIKITKKKKSLSRLLRKRFLFIVTFWCMKILLIEFKNYQYLFIK